MAKSFDISKFRKSITKSIAGLGIGFNDPTDWVSTGNYALNYLISGDFNKGIPLGKVVVFAGESGAGKSYICALITPLYLMNYVNRFTSVILLFCFSYCSFGVHVGAHQDSGAVT
jgi:hypothetical protein